MLEKGGPILDGADEVANVDVICRVGLKCPFLRAVVDFEFQVGRDPARLDWGDVGADNLAVGELVGEVTVALLAGGLSLGCGT